jgi:protein SCO1/2
MTWRAVAVAVVALVAGFLLALALRPADDGPELPGLHISKVDPAAPDLAFLDEAGEARRLTDYRGKVLVIFFGFVRCPDVCPTRLFELAQLMKALGPQRDRVQVLLATLDPDRDRPEVLRSYVTAFDPAFGALTGTPAQMDTLAARFYVAHRKVPLGADYTIDHSAATYLVDAAGKTVYVAGMETSREQLLAALKALAARAPAT